MPSMDSCSRIDRSVHTAAFALLALTLALGGCGESGAAGPDGTTGAGGAAGASRVDAGAGVGGGGTKDAGVGTATGGTGGVAPGGTGGTKPEPNPGGGDGGLLSALGMPLCNTPPSMMPPALKRTTVIGGFAGQAGQMVGIPGETTMYVIGHLNGSLYAVIDGKVAGVMVKVDATINGYERGLLSMVLHPQFKTNQIFYLFYTAAGTRNFVIDEYQRLTPMTAMKKGTIYNQPPASGGEFHNGGSLYFNPKDATPMLYLSMGNHGSRGQSGMPDGVAGRVLKFDLATAGPPTTLAYGLRNPYRMSIDRLTGDMWMGEVGDGAAGTVYFLPYGEVGKSFGYGAGTGEVKPGITGMQGGGNSVIGGIVYRGTKIPGLCGRYFFAMHNTGVVRSVVQQNGAMVGTVVNHPELNVPGAISSFSEDGEGELWITSMNGNAIYKIEAAGP